MFERMHKGISDISYIVCLLIYYIESRVLVSSIYCFSSIIYRYISFLVRCYFPKFENKIDSNIQCQYVLWLKKYVSMGINTLDLVNMVNYYRVNHHFINQSQAFWFGWNEHFLTIKIKWSGVSIQKSKPMLLKILYRIVNCVCVCECCCVWNTFRKTCQLYWSIENCNESIEVDFVSLPHSIQYDKRGPLFVDKRQAFLSVFYLLPPLSLFF